MFGRDPIVGLSSMLTK